MSSSPTTWWTTADPTSTSPARTPSVSCASKAGWVEEGVVYCSCSIVLMHVVLHPSVGGHQFLQELEETGEDAVDIGEEEEEEEDEEEEEEEEEDEEEEDEVS
ncbi:unnamed protein product [Closterium sp. NIES-54]